MSESTSRFSNCPNLPKTSTKNLYKSSAMDSFQKRAEEKLTFQLHFGQIWTKTNYRESPDSTVFAPTGNRTIEKTVLFGD